MADDTKTAERDAFIGCHMQVMHSDEMMAAHVWDNDHLVAKLWRAGRVSLAASAGSEPVAPVDRSDAANLARNMLEVHECKGITPRGVETLCKAVLAMDAVLLTRPSPPEGMAGWKLVPIEPTDEMLRAMDRAWSDAMHIGVAVSPEVWVAGVDAAPPLPASEAKEL